MTTVPLARKSGALTPLIGRDEDMERLRRAFANGSQLVTVFGPPGIGKSRLVEERAVFELDPIRIDLAHAKTLEEAKARFATALDVSARDDRDDAIVSAVTLLEERLIVLDHLDSLAHELAPLLIRLMKANPVARFLVASRVVLGLPGEVVIELSGLTAQEGGQSRGARLFRTLVAQRSGEARALALRQEPIEAIVLAIEGLPLAIELAAARASVLDVDAILASLHDDRAVLELRRPGSSSGPTTYEQAIARVWDSLTENQRKAFAYTSAFRGSFSGTALCAVLTGLVPDASDALADLMNQSLLHTERAAEPDMRLRMLRPIRAFAHQRLVEMGAEADAFQRHAAYYTSPASRDDEAETDADNLLAIAERFIDTQPAIAARAIVRGHTPVFDHAAERHSRVLDRLETSTDLDVDTLYKLALMRSVVLRSSGQTTAAREALTRGAALLHARGSEDGALLGEAWLHSNCAIYALTEGDFAASRGHLESIRAIHPHLAELTGPIDAAITAEEGKVEEAAAILEKARAELRVPDPLVLAWFSFGSTVIGTRRGQDEAARAAMRDYLKHAAAAKIRGANVTASARIGTLCMALGNYDEAAQAYLTVLAGTKPTHVLHGLALAGLSASDSMRGRLASARRNLEAATPIIEGRDSRQARETLEFARWVQARVDGDPSPWKPAHTNETYNLVTLQTAARRIAETNPPAERKVPLTIHEKGEYWIYPDGKRVNCGQRPVLKTLVAALVQRYRSAPDHPLTTDEAIRFIWKDERIQPEAARNRLYVAVSTLRSLGMTAYMIDNRKGYALDATQPIEVVGE